MFSNYLELIDLTQFIVNTGLVNASARKSATSRRSGSTGRSSGGAGTKIVGTLLGIVVVLGLILGVAEFGTRTYIAQRIVSGIENANTARGVQAEGDPSVSFGKNPVLPALTTRNIKTMKLDVPSTLTVTDPAALSGEPGITGDPAAIINGENIDLTNQANPIVGTMVIETTVPTDLIQAIANRRAQGTTRISTLTPKPSENTFDVEFSSGLVNAQLSPHVENGNLTAELTGASVLGFNIDGVAQLLGKAALDQVGMAIGNGLSVESATVTDAGLALVLRGENLPLSNMSELHFN